MSDIFYEPRNGHGLPRNPFKALVVPRPIGWISTCSARGTVNLAPYSFFNAVSDDPPVVMFSSGGRKDSVTNAEATGEFVCSIVSEELMNAMNDTSFAHPPEVSEFDAAQLETAESRLVRPPRVAAAPAALECVVSEIRPVKDRTGADTGNWLVFGEVVGVHIDGSVMRDGFVDFSAMQPVARLGYMDYATGFDVVTMNRPKA